MIDLTKIYNINCEKDKLFEDVRDIDLKIAILTEIGEFTNELKTWKWWKKTKDVNWEKVLEEYIDILFFILSLLNKKNKGSVFPLIITEDSTLDLILQLYSNVLNNKEDDLIPVWYAIAKKLSFSDKDIEDTYFKKLKINENRWKGNY